MLKKRIYTAICLAAVLFLVLWSQSSRLFGLFLLVFFCAGSWENARLFENRHPFVMAAVSGIVFIVALSWFPENAYVLCIVASVAIWILFLIPSLFRELPKPGTVMAYLYQLLYWLSILGSFLSVYVLYIRSAVLLLSILMIVWPISVPILPEELLENANWLPRFLPARPGKE